jgi:hypothetical protein
MKMKKKKRRRWRFRRKRHRKVVVELSPAFYLTYLLAARKTKKCAYMQYMYILVDLFVLWVYIHAWMNG